MNVLYLADIRLPLERANGIQTMETCHALAARGHHVTLLVRPDTQAPARDPLAFYGLPPHANLTIARVPVRGRSELRRAHYLVAALARALRTPALDIVFTRDLGLASLLLRVPRTARPPVVYESHGYAPVVSGLLPELLSTAPAASRAKGKRLAARERRVWELAEGYVTITAALAADLRTRLGERRGDAAAPAQDPAIVPDGVRLSAERRFSWSGPSANPVAVYAGHLYPWKGVDTLIDALVHAPRLRARVIGGHPAEPDLARLKQRARTAGVADRVEFLGLQPPPAVAALLATADALILPNRTSSVSAHYTSPLKLFEYLAAGRPIIASDLPALREVLRHGENAWLTPPDDAVALAAGLVRVLGDPSLALALARTAFGEAAEYSWDTRAERLEAVLAAAMSPEGAARRAAPRAGDAR